MEKHENGLCWWNTGLNEEAGESLAEVEKREGFTGPDHSGCFEGIASRMIGKICEIAVEDVLGHDLPGGLDVHFEGNGTKSGLCNLLGR